MSAARPTRPRRGLVAAATLALCTMLPACAVFGTDETIEALTPSRCATRFWLDFVQASAKAITQPGASSPQAARAFAT